MSSTVTEMRKRRNTHTRKPSNLPPNNDNLEDVLLYKLDQFLYTLESRLDQLEEFGLTKLGLVDDSVQHAYDTLIKVRSEVIGEGMKKAEGLLNFVQQYNLAAADESISNKFLQGLYYLEDKLAHIESSCFEVVDGKLAIGVQLALQSAACRLLTYDELPIQWRDNPYIIRGYRFSKGYADCVKSLIKLHNETCNIWTHLVGFFILLGMAFYHLPTTLSWTEASFMDKFTMIVFLVAAMKCLVCSAVWHTFSSYSRLAIKDNFACVDYTGITILIAASILTTEYCALYCNETARNIYMSITALFGISGAWLTWSPSFNDKNGKLKRVTFFVSFAVAGVTGFCHAAYLQGFIKTFLFYLPVLKSLFCYALGVVVYSLLIPERWFPGGIFDYFGMSHNLWHICVFGGIYYHYLATVTLLEGAKGFSCSL